MPLTMRSAPTSLGLSYKIGIPVLIPGPTMRGSSLKKLGGQFLGHADHRRDDARGDYRMNLIGPKPL